MISPLLANIYFRRFLVAWVKFGYDRKYKSRIVNYADDFVILSQGRAQPACVAAKTLLDKIGLTLNVTKTHVVRAWQTSFDFLGYTFGVQHGKGGREYLGKHVSKKAVTSYREKVRQRTERDQGCKEPETVAKELNQLTRGFWTYFQLGTTDRVRYALDEYARTRMYEWAKRKYRSPRGKRRRAFSKAKRWEKIQAATNLVQKSKDLIPRWRGGELFASAASYAK